MRPLAANVICETFTPPRTTSADWNTRSPTVVGSRAGEDALVDDRRSGDDGGRDRTGTPGRIERARSVRDPGAAPATAAVRARDAGVVARGPSAARARRRIDRGR